MNDMAIGNTGTDGQLSIAMLLYPGFTFLDLVGPQTALGFHSTIKLVAESTDLVSADSGVRIAPDCTFATCPRDLDILFVPGGFGAIDAMVDETLLGFVRNAGERARYITSVCTGSLILAAAGLLQGYEATTHWAWHDVLATFGATPVARRIVFDGNRMSGGGVTSGIDFGLALLAELRGEDAAKTVQLMMEYDPAPPFDAGTPGKAGPAITALAEAKLGAAAERALMIKRHEASGFLFERQAKASERA